MHLYDPAERALFIERTGVILRWVLICVCSMIELFVTPIIPLLIFWIALPVAVVYNGAVHWLVSRKPSFIRRLSMLTAVGDIVVSLILIYFGGGNDLYLWYFVLLVSHAARFSFVGAIVSPLVFSGLYVLGLRLHGIDVPFIDLALRVTFLSTTGLVSGYLAREEKRRFLSILASQKETILAEQKREEMRGVLRRYVSYNVVEELLSHPESLCVGGIRRHITVLFSDIQGFTSLLANADPEAFILILNEYLGEMTDIIFRYDGMVDKFVGDAIIGIFGGISSCEEDPDKAVHCAIAMQKRLGELQEKWKAASTFVFNARIGVNSGDAILGNIGSSVRMDYTAIGDAVNTASRLQSIAEINTIVISRSTRDALGGAFECVSLGEIQLKGKPEPIEVFQVLGEKP